MKQRKIARIVLALAVVLALTMTELTPLSMVQEASAVTQADIDKLKDELSGMNSEKAQLEKELKSIQNNKNTALAQKENIDKQINILQSEIRNVESLISEYETLIEQTEQEIRENEEEEKRQYEKFCARVRSMEERGTVSYWSVLFNAASFTDLLSAMDFISEIMDSDQKVIDDLRALREQIEQVNVTMGYPLRQTMAYSFVERLVELQSRRKPGRDGEPMYYHSDVTGLLLHPYVRACDPAAAGLAAEILRRQSIYVRRSMLVPGSVIDPLFAPAGSWQELSAYIRDSLSLVILHAASADDVRQRREFFSVIVDRICRLENSLAGSGLEVTTPVFASLLRKMLQDVRIPYEGEPLSGVQIMGILETRNLDFEHVLVLSVNDDTFPGNRAVSSSFIPYNLRYAYGLPTPQHHEGVYAYYFYRLLQRAETVHLAYCSRSDDKRTGEPSRYVYQLEYESPHRPLRRAIRLGVNLTKTEPVSASKTGRTARILEEYLDGGGRSLSPTAFYQYVECPLRFYFRHVAGLKPVEEIAEEVDLPMFGTILHRAMELLYMPLLGDPSPQRTIASLPGTPAVKEAVVRAVNEEYLQDPKATEEEYGGSVLLVRDVVRKYIDSCILPYDASQRGYAVERLEAPVEYRVPLERDGRVRSVGFAGKADRIDRLSDGALRVVDYKTGKPHNCFRDVAALFSSVAAERSPAVLQTLLYAMMLSQSENCDVQPALYYVRSMQDERFSPLLVEGDRPVLRFSDYRESLNGHLQKTLSELFDFSKPFEQCEDRSVCAYCDFREICRR